MPLVEVIRAHAFAAERIHADDTIVPVLATGKTRTGRLWTYVRDDRPFAGRDPPAAAFFYSRDRGREHPEQHLAGFGGLMQADAYAGFNRLYEAARKPDPIIEVACWAHAMPVEQRRRARAAGSGRGAQELAGGCYLHANRHRQAQRRRSAGLARRYAGAARRIADLLPCNGVDRAGAPDPPVENLVAFLNSTPQGPHKLATILSHEAKQLLAMDRYERRALSRRKSAIRAFDETRRRPTIATVEICDL